MLYERIFQTAKREGVQQKELAEYLGVLPAVITDWKTGRCKPSVEAIVKLADFFSVSTDFLLGRTVTNSPMDIPGKKKEPAMWHNERTDFMDMNTLIESTRTKHKETLKARQDKVEILPMIVSEVLEDFERFFSDPRLVVAKADNQHFMRRTAQLKGADVEIASIVIDKSGDDNNKLDGHLAGFLLLIEQPVQKRYPVSVGWSIRKDASLDFYYGEGVRVDTKHAFDSFYHILETIIPMSESTPVHKNRANIDKLA